VNTVVHRYDNGKSALGIAVMKTFLPAMISWHFAHSTPCAIYREESITKAGALSFRLVLLHHQRPVAQGNGDAGPALCISGWLELMPRRSVIASSHARIAHEVADLIPAEENPVRRVVITGETCAPVGICRCGRALTAGALG